MAILLAKRKWEQGYYLPHERVAIDAEVHCRDCSYKLQTTYLRCNFSGPSGRFTCNAGGTCKHATTEDTDLLGMIADE